jgi:hypothetical protein
METLCFNCLSIRQNRERVNYFLTTLFFDNIPLIAQDARVMACHSLLGAHKAIPRDGNKITNSF